MNLIVASPQPTPGNHSTQYATLLLEAATARETHQVNHALDLLDRALSINPKDWAAQLLIALTLMDVGSTDEAEAYLLSSKENAPQSLESSFKQALVFMAGPDRSSQNGSLHKLPRQLPKHLTNDFSLSATFVVGALKRSNSDEGTIRMLRQLQHSSEELLGQLQGLSDITPPRFGSPMEARHIDALFPQISITNLKRVSGPWPQLLPLSPFPDTLATHSPIASTAARPGDVQLTSTNALVPGIPEKQVIASPASALTATDRAGIKSQRACGATQSIGAAAGKDAVGVVFQVAAFSRRERALETAERLKQLKVPVTATNERDLFLVRVGPVTETEAAGLRAELVRLGFPDVFATTQCK